MVNSSSLALRKLDILIRAPSSESGRFFSENIGNSQSGVEMNKSLTQTEETGSQLSGC